MFIFGSPQLCSRLWKHKCLRIVTASDSEKVAKKGFADGNQYTSICFACGQRNFFSLNVDILPPQRCNIREALTGKKASENDSLPLGAARRSQNPTKLGKRERAALVGVCRVFSRPSYK